MICFSFIKNKGFSIYFSKYSVYFWGILLLILISLSIPELLAYIPLDYNEGWNATLARRVFSGSYSLYPARDGFIFNNYPPLSFILIGVIAYILGCDVVFVGRGIAFLSIILIAILIGRIIHNCNGKTHALIYIPIIFLLTSITAFHNYFGMDDPQWLAQLVMLSGLWVLLGRRGEALSSWSVCSAACLMVCGLFIKHNLVALPCAVSLWLLFFHRRFFPVWSAACAIVFLAVGLCFYTIYGHWFLEDIFHHEREIRLGRFFHGPRELVWMIGLLYVGGAYVLRRAWRRHAQRRTGLFCIFLVLSIIGGSLSGLGKGVDYNCMFDALIAASLLCGDVLAKYDTLGGGRRGQLLYVKACVIVSLPLFFLVPVRFVQLDKELAVLPHQKQVWAERIAFVQKQTGTVLCTDMILCHWAGQPLSVDVFNLGEAFKKNDQDYRIRYLIREKRFNYIAFIGRKEDYIIPRDALTTWLKQSGYIFKVMGPHSVGLLQRPD